MKMRLYAAIVSEKSDLPETKLLYGLGKAMKQLERLEKAVGEAWDAMTVQRQAHPVTDYQCVFIAPEYYFSNRRHAQDRFFSHDVKRAIISGLSSIAKRYPKMLIVPGTVLWTKDLLDTKVIATNTGPKTFKVSNPERTKKLRDRAIYAGNTHGTTINQVGWSHTRPTGTINRKLAQNVAYLCLGDTVVKYQKIGNYQEVRGEADDLLFMPGSLIGRFNIGGVKWGIEICMDHALGVFHSSVNSVADKVHVQIIVSSYVGAPTNSDASVTLHSSTEPHHVLLDNQKGTASFTGTNQIRFGGDKVGKLAREPLKKDRFTLWVVDLDSPGITNVNNYTLTSTSLKNVEHIH